MKPLIVYPQSEEQLSALIKIVEEIKIPYQHASTAQAGTDAEHAADTDTKDKEGHLIPDRNVASTLGNL